MLFSNTVSFHSQDILVCVFVCVRYGTEHEKDCDKQQRRTSSNTKHISLKAQVHFEPSAAIALTQIWMLLMRTDKVRQ